MNTTKIIALGLGLFLSVNTFAQQHRAVMWEKFNSVSPNLLQIGNVSTLPTAKMQPSLWSIGCETLDRDYADYQQYKEYLDELGIKKARIQSGWAKTEPKKGQYNFEWLDVIVKDITSRNVEPWMVLCYGNPIYGGDEKLGGKIFTDQPTMDGWLKYVRATVKRYKGQVREWEVWNEPNLRGNDKSPEAYANLLMNTVEVIKSEQPEAVILGFSIAGTRSVKFVADVYDILKKNNKTGIVDYLTFHPYENNPDNATIDIKELDKLAKSYNPNVKLYQGENGCPSILEWGHALNQHPWTEISQAKWFLRRMSNDWSLGIRSSVFTLVDLQYFNMLQSFGLLRTSLEKKIIYKRPSYHAVQHMINLFPGNVTAGSRLTYSANTMNPIAVQEVKKDNITIGALIWQDDNIPSDKLEWDYINLTIKSLSLKNPVLVEIITGRVYSLEKSMLRNVGADLQLKNFPTWDSPMLLIEKDQLVLRQASGDTSGNSQNRNTVGIL